MKKIIIATHHKLAKGFKDTLEYIIPNTVEIIDINAYVQNVSIENQIEECLKKFDKNEQKFVFTDLQVGSVNQAFIGKIKDYNIELISGINLTILMAIALQIDDGKISVDSIREEIKNAQQELIYVNDEIKKYNKLDDEDE